MGASPHFISAMDQPILGLKNLSKTFPGQLALDQVDLKVYGGSIHALLGHNGSGKSTLIKLLSGFEKADYGYSAFLNGQRVDLWNGSKQNSSLIRIVHQDLGLVQTIYYWTINEVHLDPVFGYTSCCFWTSETHKDIYAWHVNFIRGKAYPSIKKGQKNMAAGSASLSVTRPVRGVGTSSESRVNK